ncbi:MAG: EamA family transporter [Gammaproteobacteria bacterium]|nr:EamA family transporter [Gammaproteobacteria bacterium]
MTWFTLSLISAFMWAIAIAVDKLVLVRWQVTPALMCFLAALVEFAAAGGVWVVLGLSEMPYPAIALALCAGIFKTLFYLFYYLAVTREEVSRIATLDSLTPLAILLSAGFVLNESLQPQEYLGVILVVSGAVLITCKGRLYPRLNLAFCFALLGVLCTTVNQIITKHLLETTDYWTVFAAVRVGVFFAVLPLLPKVISSLKVFRSERKWSVLTLIAANNTIAVSGLFIFTIAVSLGPVTLVNALGSVHSIFLLLIVVVIGVVNPGLLREELKKSVLMQKLIAILLMVSGTVAISGISLS